MEPDLRVIRLCVELGFVRPETIVRCADAVIEAEQSPDPIFYDLALVEHKRDAEILDLLEDFRDASADPATWEKVLRWVAEKVRAGELDVPHVVRRIWALASAGHPNEDLSLAFSILEDQCDLARDRIYGSLSDVRINLLETLDRFGVTGALAKVAG